MDENWVPWDTMPGKQRVVLSDSTCRDRSQPHWRRQSEQPYHEHHVQDPLKAKYKNKMFREYNGSILTEDLYTLRSRKGM